MRERLQRADSFIQNLSNSVSSEINSRRQVVTIYAYSPNCSQLSRVSPHDFRLRLYKFFFSY